MTDFTVDPAMAAAIDSMKRELLIVLTRRLGGRVALPVVEVDATEGIALRMEVSVVDRSITLDLVGRDGQPLPAVPVSAREERETLRRLLEKRLEEIERAGEWNEVGLDRCSAGNILEGLAPEEDTK